MGGALIETEARKILNKGISKGRSEGINEGIRMGIRALVASLKSLSIPDETIEAQLMERYQMSKDEAMEWARKARGG